ncbi:MAG: hypothetical protein QOH09_4697 [Pseudonocardiales bacterium]|nr:hypothetical protein [Pseudonocardiales bacterium]
MSVSCVVDSWVDTGVYRPAVTVRLGFCCRNPHVEWLVGLRRPAASVHPPDTVLVSEPCSSFRRQLVVTVVCIPGCPGRLAARVRRLVIGWVGG